MKLKARAIAITLGLVGFLAWRVAADNQTLFGEPFANLTTEQLNRFLGGKDGFAEVETVEDGLGPVFNGTSCAECHSVPAIGGDSNIVETRFGTTTNNHFDALPQFGGSLIQSQGIGQIGSCNFVGESVPQQATIVALRKTTSLLGLGLVDNVPDKIFREIAQIEQKFLPATAGRPNIVKDVTTGRMAVGKFGHKAQVPGLKHFSADAYLNEMGITSPFFPTENCPQGDCSSVAACDPVADPEDDGSGVQAFTDFMTFLAPPRRGRITPQVLAGERVFFTIGCANCHLPALETGSNPIAALNRVTFFPFSDFLLHDMGSLGDGIEQGQAGGREMRTAPLWGLRVRTSFLHNGSAPTIEDAILAHDGQGQRARNRFSALNSKEMQSLMAFLKSL